MTRILHLSDTHVSANGPDEDGVDGVGSLARMLHDARHVPGLDLVVVSGDVADDGSAAGCVTVRDHVQRFAAARGIPHVYSTGNHDRRPGFAQALGSGHLGPDGTDRGTLLHHPERLTRAAVSHVGDTRIVTLDSLVPGEVHGVVDAAQLSALAELLATPAAGGTVLILHHPPLVVPALPFVERIALQNIAELAGVVRGRDVRVILAGHLHLQLVGSLAGIPVCVTPGIVTRIDTTAQPHVIRGVLGAGATVVEFDDADDSGVTSYTLTARDPRAGEEVYVYEPN